MDIEDFILFREPDRNPHAPKLALELSVLKDGDSEMRSLPRGLAQFAVLFTLRHESEPDDSKKIVIEWEAADLMRLSGFVLLHKTKDGLRKCDIPPVHLTGDMDCIGDIEIAQGASFARKHMLSYSYHKALEAGETYIFFWPGGKVNWWDWGTSSDRKDRSQRTKDAQNRTRSQIIIPASNAIEFTGSADIEPCIERPSFEKAPFMVANQWEAVWRRRKDKRARIDAPACLTAAYRSPDAPILRRTIEGPSRIHKSCGKVRPCETTETTTYVIPENADAATMRPITLLDCSITDNIDRYCESLYSVLPSSASGSQVLKMGHVNWGVPIDGYEPDQNIHIPSDDKVGSFTPSSHPWCHTLHPGQSITFTAQMYPFDELEEILHVGEKYEYRFNGKALRWWDWGTKEDHKDEVKLGGKENSGRPTIVIPSTTLDLEVTL